MGTPKYKSPAQQEFEATKAAQVARNSLTTPTTWYPGETPPEQRCRVTGYPPGIAFRDPVTGHRFRTSWWHNTDQTHLHCETSWSALLYDEEKRAVAAGPDMTDEVTAAWINSRAMATVNKYPPVT